MASPRSLETELLRPAADLVHDFAGGKGVRDRLALLAAVAALHANVSAHELWELIEDDSTSHYRRDALSLAPNVLATLAATPISPALAIASLARPDLSASEQRSSGTYLTDFRLSTLLMSRLARNLPNGSKILDPAVGTGAFCAAFVEHASKAWRTSPSTVVSDCLFAADRASDALNATICSLAATGASAQSLLTFKAHSLQVDSLQFDWSQHEVQSFDAVVGNPPWERLKLTRHEYLRSNGEDRHYGDAYHGHSQNDDYHATKREVNDYRSGLRSRFSLQKGEDDLYKLFLELAMNLVRAEGGFISMLVPAGLIRSNTARDLRTELVKKSARMDCALFFNHHRFFAIDSRFKFLAIDVRTGNKTGARSIYLSRGEANPEAATFGRPISIPTKALSTIRPDLTIPEVATQSQWRLFRDASIACTSFGDQESGWQPRIVREVDMTRDRALFHSAPSVGNLLPVIEGRMVHQYRYRAKAYRGGTGRRAIWQPQPIEFSEVQPQFWLQAQELSPSLHARAFTPRMGFCDITGQTNERTLLASQIPPGSICGNKVPTVTFEGDADQHRAWAWLGLANSLMVDWLMRRICTTTINYFILLSLPLPEPSSYPRDLAEVARIARRLAATEGLPSVLSATNLQDAEELRAEIEWRTLALYGFDASALTHVLADFPLLDRAEAPLNGESRSTITADLVALRAVQALGGKFRRGSRQLREDELASRVLSARELGAQAFRPADLAPPFINELPSHLFHADVEPPAVGVTS